MRGDCMSIYINITTTSPLLVIFQNKSFYIVDYKRNMLILNTLYKSCGDPYRIFTHIIPEYFTHVSCMKILKTLYSK